MPHGRLSRPHPQMKSSSPGRNGAKVTAVHRHLGPYSALQQWAVPLHHLLPSPLSLPLSPSWQRKKPEGLQGMQLQKRCILWDTGKSSRETDSREGGAVCRLGRWPNAASSAAVAQQWREWGNDQTAGQRTAWASTAQRHRQGARGREPASTAIPRLSFHSENRILRKI